VVTSRNDDAPAVFLAGIKNLAGLIGIKVDGELIHTTASHLLSFPYF
jgi:hypothetical protein